MQEPKSFKFPCPYCGQHLEADDDMVGERVNCPGCGGLISVPNRPPPKIVVVKKGGGFLSRHKGLVVGGAVGLVLLFLFAVVIAAACADDGSEVTARAAEDSEMSQPEPDEPAMPKSKGYVGPRKFVLEHIEKNGNCRLVAITKRGGNVVVSGRNDWASVGCPRELVDVLQGIVDDDGRIVDVCLTECDDYVVIYGVNAVRWSSIPREMERALREYNSSGEELYSATFNDAGDWIVVSSEHYACSETWLTDWLREGNKRYGVLRAAAVTEDAAVAVFDDGFKFFGNVPEEMKDALRKADFDVRIIKIAGSAWFIADRSGYRYQGNM